MLTGTHRASLRGSGWHHSCFTQQGFPSLPAEDNHQKILGQSSGIILTPPVKEREKSWSKNKSDSAAFFIFSVGPAGRVAGGSLAVKTWPLTRCYSMWPFLILLPVERSVTSDLNFVLITPSFFLTVSSHFVLTIHSFVCRFWILHKWNHTVYSSTTFLGGLNMFLRFIDVALIL